MTLGEFNIRAKGLVADPPGGLPGNGCTGGHTRRTQAAVAEVARAESTFKQ